MERHVRFLLPRLVLAAYLLSVCLLCFLNLGPETDMSAEWFGIPKDKIAHFAMFFPYPGLVASVFCKTGWKPARTVGFLLLVLVSGIAAGGAIELIQGLTGYRSADIGDFRADCIGLFAGTVLTLVLWLAIHDRKKAGKTGR